MNDSSYRKTVLSNGLRIITERMPHLRSVSVGYWIVVGSRDETIENNGISHVIEHMLFKGTTNRTVSQIARSLESVGGNLDAFTSREISCYNAHILDEHLPLAIDVLSDILLNSVLDESELTKEKDVILREINHVIDTPDELVFENFYADIFPNHPLGYSISGTAENVSTFSRNALVDFMQQMYTSNRIVIAAAGNVDHDRLVELILEKFSLPQSAIRRQSYPIPELGHLVSIYPNHCTQAHICLGAKGCAQADKRRAALILLHLIAGGGMSSRLFQIVREVHGLAYAVYTFTDHYFDTGLFGVYLATVQANVERALDLVKSELAKLSHGELDNDELEQAKSQLKGNIMLGLESASSRMSRLANMEIYRNEYKTLDDVIAEIDSVTLAQMNDISSESFADESYCITMLTPENS
ncbi:insulinase family protein [candidate division KSB1 bacterium]|nr:insulinase family protein [candidate division KSB1 bacterium]